MKKILFLILCITGTSLFAGSREQAYRLHNRIAGVPPSTLVLNQMEQMINSKDRSIAQTSREVYKLLS